jgi:hypothetical protein
MSVNKIDVNAVNERTRRVAEYSKEFNVTPEQVKKEVKQIRGEKRKTDLV